MPRHGPALKPHRPSVRVDLHQFLIEAPTNSQRIVFLTKLRNVGRVVLKGKDADKIAADLGLPHDEVSE